MVYTCPDETHSYNYLKISQIFLGPHFSEIIQSHYIQSHSEIIQSLCVRALHAPIGLNGPDQPQQDPPPACPLPVRPESPFQLISLSLTELHHTTVSLQLCLMLFLIGLPGWTPSWTHHCILSWLLTWLITEPLTATSTLLLRCCGTTPSRCHPLYWDSPSLILFCGAVCPYCSLAITIIPKALLNEIPLWRVKP